MILRIACYLLSFGLGLLGGSLGKLWGIPFWQYGTFMIIGFLISVLVWRLQAE